MLAPRTCACGCGASIPANRVYAPHHHTPVNPSGLCECGCGEMTRIAPYTDHARGRVKGEHHRFVRGHNGRQARLVDPWTVDSVSGCWLWDGAVSRNGYGMWRGTTAHRRVYEDRVGPIPTDHELHHRCENKRCVNPAHLEPLPGAIHARIKSSYKITNAQVQEIRELAERGVRVTEIARRFGISHTYVVELREGRKRVPC